MGKDVSSITRLSVAGFKSICDATELAIRPITILAGANSSGKSSFMQPLLLLKQTMKWSFSAKTLKIGGPNVSFTSWKQLFSRNGADRMTIGVYADSFSYIRTIGADPDGKITIDESVLNSEESTDVEIITNVIHVPGWRQISRTYDMASTESSFKGRFTNVYAASVIEDWQETIKQSRLDGHKDDPFGHRKKFDDLNRYMRDLGLASNISAYRKSLGGKISVLVSRYPGSDDMINMADAGFAVSQAVPVLTALLTAEPGQLVYIEQPELHLHPKAQLALSGILVEAANRGVVTVIETHSPLFYTGVSTHIARRNVRQNDVILHWFEQNPESGYTQVESVHFNINGAATNEKRTVDFSDIELSAHRDYIQAVGDNVFGKVS